MNNVLLLVWISVLSAAFVFGESLTLVSVGGGGHRMSSTDGKTFGNHEQWGPCGHDANDLLHVTYGNGKFVAVGGWSKPRIVVSKDGKDWEEVPESEFEKAKGAAFRVLFADGSFHFLTLSGNMMRSEDGKEWQHIGDVPLTKKPDLERIRDLAYGNGTFVGVGDFGVVAVSKDMGKTWTASRAKHHGKERTWPKVEFGAGRFVIAGVDGYTASSKDGETWEHETTHGGAFKKISEINWTGKEFYAYASAVKGAPHRLISKDGIEWTSRLKWSGVPVSVWLFDGTYYGVQDDFFKGNTKIYRSKDGEDWELSENEKGYSARCITANR